LGFVAAFFGAAGLGVAFALAAGLAFNAGLAVVVFLGVVFFDAVAMILLLKNLLNRVILRYGCCC
jgi:hypothetical protein